MFAFSKTADLN